VNLRALAPSDETSTVFSVDADGSMCNSECSFGLRASLVADLRDAISPSCSVLANTMVKQIS